MNPEHNSGTSSGPIEARNFGDMFHLGVSVRPLQTFGTKRVCRLCDTTLSVYNPEAECAVCDRKHGPFNVETPCSILRTRNVETSRRRERERLQRAADPVKHEADLAARRERDAARQRENRRLRSAVAS